MTNDNEENTFLSRWANNQLTDEEKREFESHPDFNTYKKIIEGTDQLELKAFDTDKVLMDVKSKGIKKNPIQLWHWVAIAASIAAVIGLFFLFPSPSHTTDYGQTMAITLPDQSKVMLNAKSTISFDENTWDQNRIVKLHGEAFFDVEKGSTFTVVTDNGKVEVLGTEFNVQSYTEFIEVACYEGKVHVKLKEHEQVITAGYAFRKLKDKGYENWTVYTEQPLWLTEANEFLKVPIIFVIQKLKNQYDLTIKNTKVLDKKAIFTGSFPNDNLEVALKTVFSTLDIQYNISNDKKTILLK